MGETLVLKNAPAVSAFASVVGQKEADGPLGRRFDAVEPDARAGQDSWEKAESAIGQAAKDKGLRTVVEYGGAVVYGSRFDFMVKGVIGCEL